MAGAARGRTQRHLERMFREIERAHGGLAAVLAMASLHGRGGPPIPPEFGPGRPRRPGGPDHPLPAPVRPDRPSLLSGGAEAPLDP